MRKRWKIWVHQWEINVQLTCTLQDHEAIIKIRWKKRASPWRKWNTNEAHQHVPFYPIVSNNGLLFSKDCLGSPLFFPTIIEISCLLIPKADIFVPEVPVVTFHQVLWSLIEYIILQQVFKKTHHWPNDDN